MDSTSRTPYFGLSLLPKAKDRSESIHREIRRDGSRQVSAETADLRFESPVASSGWWPGKSRTPSDQELPMRAVPLPRTDSERLKSVPNDPTAESPRDSAGSLF